MSQVVIGMDPHKRSATIEVMAGDETVLGGGRYATDVVGYRAMRAEVKHWPERIWAIEGCQGTGRHIANRLLADGEDVVDVPPKLSARTRVFATGQGRKTDAADAHSVALAATRMTSLRRVVDDQQLAVLRIMELSALLAVTATTLTDLHGMGPSGAARLLVEVGDITRFPTRAHFASWNGTAPIDASSGDQIRHRLSRAGNRQINRVLHIMAVVQLRNHTEGRAYFDRKVATGKTPREAMRALKRRLSDIVYHQMITDARTRITGPGGHVGAATGSSAACSNPNAGTSEKSLPGPAINDLTPAKPALPPGRSRHPSSPPGRSRRRGPAHTIQAGNDPS